MMTPDCSSPLFSSRSSLSSFPPCVSSPSSFIHSLKRKCDQIAQKKLTWEQLETSSSYKDPSLSKRLFIDKKSILADYSAKLKMFDELKIPSKQWMSIEKVEGKFQIKMPGRKAEKVFYENTFKKENVLYVFRNTSNDKYLIGKTTGSFKKRCDEHLQKAFDYPTLVYHKKVIDQEFLQDLNQNPTSFQVALLYEIKNEERDSKEFEEVAEDLEELEKAAIEAKRALDTSDENKWVLYNCKGGGGGGRGHPKTQTATYIIPKRAEDYTPEKYFKFDLDEGGNVCFKNLKALKKLVKSEEKIRLENSSPTHSPQPKAFIYCIKNIEDCSQRYIGVTANPLTRPCQHSYQAKRIQTFKRENSDSTDKVGSVFHQVLSKKGDKMAFGILRDIPSTEIKGQEELYHVFDNIAETEAHLIAAKKAHVKQGGLNERKGGGGSYPVAKKAKLN